MGVPARRAAGVAAVVVGLAGAVSVLAGGDDPAAPGPGVAALASALEREAALDAASARCTAQALAATHDMGRLEDLPPDAVLTAAAGCLWPAAPPGR
jgi:hypothetical protein